MGEVIEFRTKRPSENSKDRQNRAFWKGPPEDTDSFVRSRGLAAYKEALVWFEDRKRADSAILDGVRAFLDTAPSEYQAPTEDSA